MEVLLKIEDHAKKVHSQLRIKFSNEATVRNLMSKLEEVFGIKSDYQEIFHGEMKIHLISRDSLLSEIDVQNGNTLMVKHLMLEEWLLFKVCIEDIKKWNEKKKYVKKFVDVEFKRIEIFEKNSFFALYPKLGIEAVRFRREFAHYIIDTDEEYMKSAAEVYFLQFHGNNPEDPEFEVKFGEKTNPGAQGGLMCSVLRKGQLLKNYHIKSHLGASVRSPDHDKVDLRELFVYKLLMTMKVGPNVHFIKNTLHSTFGLYIATEDVCGFRQANVERPSAREKLKLELLSYILYLTDLHSANYGVDEKGYLCIVDFRLEHKYYAKKNLPAKNIKEIEDDIKQWNLQTSLKKADQAIDVQRRIISSGNIMRSGTHDYKNYYNQIKENIEHVLGIVEEVPKKKQKQRR